MREAGRATAALAALVALAAGAAALLASHLARLLPPRAEAVARYCRLPGAGAGLDASSGSLLAALAGLAAWVGLGLLVGGAVLAVARLARTLWTTRRLSRLLKAATDEAPPEAAGRVAAGAAACALRASPVVTGARDHPAAFTIGLLRPRVIVSAAVVEALTDAELDALLLHEAAHARRRDPLRLLVAGFCRDLLFFLPAGHALFGLVREAQERAADDAAADVAGPVEVAGALLAFLKLAGRRPRLEPAAAGADPEARIRRLLEAPAARPPASVRPPRALASLLVSAVLLAGLGGPPAPGAGEAPAGCCPMTALSRPAAPCC